MIFQPVRYVSLPEGIMMISWEFAGISMISWGFMMIEGGIPMIILGMRMIIDIMGIWIQLGRPTG